MRHSAVVKMAHKLLEDGRSLDRAEPWMQNYKPFVYAIIKRDPLQLQFAIPRFREDRDIVAAAVGINGDALGWAHPDLQDDEEIALIAVKQRFPAFEYLSPRLKKNRTIVKAALTRDGLTFGFIEDPYLQDDEELATLAVENEGFALEYLSPRLKREGKIVLMAVKNNG